MKKIYLFLSSIFLLTCSVNAQVQMYEYDSKTFNEETIQRIVAASRQKGIEEWEVQKLEQNLYKRLERFKAGTLADANRYNGNNTIQQACTNVDFEQGNYNGWTLTSGDINGVALPCNTCPSTAGGIAAVTTSSNSGSTWGSGVDNCTGLPVVAPGGGNYSLCLNDKSSGGKIMKIQQTFSVTASNNIFTFQYFAVLQNPSGHSTSEQPYFLCQVLDGSNTLIPCTYYYAYGSSSNPGWSSTPNCSGPAYYKPWTTITIDLTSYVGQNVTIQFIVSDCAQGGHYGYAYIDGSCGQVNYTNNAGICSGANAQLCGPPGYASYTWTGPATGNQQCLNTGTPGTYTLATTSALGCPSPSLTYTVTQAPAPTASFSVANQACSLAATFTDQSTVPSGGTLGNWSWNFGDGQTATSTTAGNVQTHTYSTAGTYTVVMTCTTTAGCVATQSVPVTVSSGLVTNNTSTPVNCNGGSSGSATITPTGGSGSYTYTWSPQGGSNTSASNLPAGNYTVNVDDGAGCTTTTVVTVTQPTALSASGSSTPAGCGQSNGTAGVNVSGGTGPYTYTWSPNGGNGSTASGLVAGGYTVNVTDSKGCPTSATASVATTAGPAISSAAATNVICNGGTNGSATVSASGGTGTLSYTWAPNSVSGSAIGNLGAGSYTCTVTDANGCNTSTVVAVTEPPVITTNASYTATACGMSNGAAEILASGGTGPYTYTWTPIGVSGTTATNLAAGAYTCTITDALGCQKVVQALITTSSGPTITVQGSTSVTCNGGSNGTAIVSVSGGNPGYTYTWTPSGGNDTTAANLPAGTYTFVVADVIGCLSTKTVTIAQPSALVPTLTPTHLSCFGGSNGAANIVMAGGTGPYTYTWSPGGSNNATISNLIAGNYTVSVKDANNCTDTYTLAINQPPQLVATVNTSSVICNGGTTGSATVSVSGGSIPYTYTWTPIGGSSATAVNLPAGVYNITIRDNNNCPLATTATLTEAGPIVLNVASTNVLCFGAHNGTATVTPTGGTPAFSYTWSPSGGSNATASNLAPNTYTVHSLDANSCASFTTVTITTPTIIAITSTVTPIKCSGASNGSAAVNVTGGTPTYTINWNTTPPQVGNSATNLGEGSYTVTVTDQNGCVKKKTVVMSSPPAKDTLDLTGTLCTTDPTVVLSAPQGGVAPNVIGAPYQWYDGSNAIAGETNSTYTASQANVTAGLYMVTWFYKGCRYKTTDVIETFYQDLNSLPRTNIFTPNGDRANDEFIPFSFAQSGGNYTSAMLQSLVSKYEIWIYDRWGKEMFNTTDITHTWDGKTEGAKDAPDGTYYWVVKFKTTCGGLKNDQETKGFVQLIR